MDEDKEELIAFVRQKMQEKEGGPSECFYQVVKEDPYLLKDLFQTFSEDEIVDAILAEKASDANCIGVWIRRKGESLPTYAEIYSSNVQNLASEMKKKTENLS